ncbi:uncharacterized protein BDZ99DRAFT_408930 [Mytilinidion resinicola]|uniref:Actin-like ATPase domain-containing protein n=1 Tax=Mytilinidion resinicola TaxID=574789 RepID=A0A6A6Z4J6_9PEZI|nr:uncharacterized protein BDZ99DRAFT_408930 [Mytilinidion resinicola]KAF2815177.1 hypothetical protein BDZ99DRAFT_408930 [Mytilinidion resinicola]
MAAEIVVGIDFGTTGGNQNVRLITDWPNPGSLVASAEKVPTAISYKDGKPNNWGYNVEMTEKSSFKWFKILLDPEHKLRNKAEPVVASSSLLSSLQKTAEDVAADYLRLVWEYTRDDIRRMKGDDWESLYSLKVVLTVPAIWSPAAKEKTEKVALAAGLPKNLSLVSEPEAAALAVMKDKNDEEKTMQVGDAFVVCDAGGGTVDLISYKVTGVNPMQMEECAVGDGDLCGSVFVDAAFEKYVKTVVGEGDYNTIREKAKKRMMKEFEVSVKRCYTGDNKEFSVDLPGVEDNPDEGIEDDTIRTVTARIARHNYGTSMCIPFDSSKHLAKDRRRLPDGNWYAKGQMEWLLRKVRLVGDSDSSSRCVKLLCIVEYGIDCDKLWHEKSFRNPETKQKYRAATFHLVVRLDTAKLQFRVFYKDKPVAFTEADYKEDLATS